MIHQRWWVAVPGVCVYVYVCVWQEPVMICKKEAALLATAITPSKQTG